MAAEHAVGTLAPEEQQDLAATVVQSLDTPEQQRAAAEGAVGALTTQQRQQLAENVLGRPDRETRQNLWYVVIWTMAAAIFVFGSMAFVLIYQKKAAEAPLALATTALGGVVGLVATSLGSGRSAEHSKTRSTHPEPVTVRYKGSLAGPGPGRFQAVQGQRTIKEDGKRWKVNLQVGGYSTGLRPGRDRPGSYLRHLTGTRG
jgi:hypothetical protein